MTTNCLLTFQKLHRRELSSILPYLTGKGAVAADYSTLYFHMWNAYLRTEYAVCDGVLFLRRNTRHGIFYYPPLRAGKGELLADVPLLFEMLDTDCVQLCAIPEESLELLQENYTVLNADGSRRFADYIYAAEDLATLRGHRYNKKRNLVHQFEKLYPAHIYEEITRENIGDLVAFMQTMMRENEQTEDERFECERVLDVLSDYFLLPLCGGLVRVEGRVAAFAVGERLDDTLLVHIEKADRAFKGAYQYINYCFVREELARAPFSLVNREDDTGDEGLRQAKLSYHPVNVLQKYRVVLKKGKEGGAK